MGEVLACIKYYSARLGPRFNDLNRAVFSLTQHAIFDRDETPGMAEAASCRAREMPRGLRTWGCIPLKFGYGMS